MATVGLPDGKKICGKISAAADGIDEEVIVFQRRADPAAGGGLLRLVRGAAAHVPWGWPFSVSSRSFVKRRFPRSHCRQSTTAVIASIMRGPVQTAVTEADGNLGVVADPVWAVSASRVAQRVTLAFPVKFFWTDWRTVHVNDNIDCSAKVTAWTGQGCGCSGRDATQSRDITPGVRRRATADRVRVGSGSCVY